jgi:hypothetical protein
MHLIYPQDPMDMDASFDTTYAITVDEPSVASNQGSHSP